jgi:predicted ATPase/DNA-binding SARP family transcriptional activator
LCLLGPPQVMVDGDVVMGPGAKKALALLAYLALEADRLHPRATLAALFWPDQLEKQALQALRQTLSRLRRAIGDQDADPPHLLVKNQRIQFNRQSDYWLDVETLGALVAKTERHRHRRLDACPSCLSQLGEAAEYYRGEFLANLHPAGSPLLDEWLLIQRERLQQQACITMQALATSHLARGEPDVARRYARRLLYLDPWNEAAQRLMLHSLLLMEGRNAVLQHYGAFRQELADELGVEPEDATLALVEQIRAGTLAGMQPHLPLGSLPTPTTSFVGRDAEQARLAECLAGQDQRLITLYGPGGSGKSRLALEVAAGQAPLWRDGVWFIPLVGVPVPEALVDALAVALDLRADGQPLAAEQLIEFLEPKELLLILDSFEHLVAAASLLEDVVRWAPEVRILVTSRARLGVRGEWAMPLGGLRLPAGEPATIAEAEDRSAVQLFVQSARRVDPTFHLTAENLPHVTRICRLVEGLPLGIELAAAWVRLYHCRQIASEIEGSLDFLQARGIGSPQRHHSLRGTFDYSYNLLSEAERALFRRLSVFRGGFWVEAARQVAGGGPRDLDSLLDKSLLQTSPTRRLDLHLTLRDYAAEKLAEHPREETRTRAQHSRVDLTFLWEREEAIAGEHAQEALDLIQGEIANVRTAWEWGVAQNAMDALSQSAPTLAHFYNRSGLFQEGETAFGNAAEHLLGTSPAPDSPASMRLLARLRLEQARFLFGLGRYARIPEYTQAAITLATHPAKALTTCRKGVAAACRDRTIEAQAELIRGYVHHNQGEAQPARACYERALTLSRTGGSDAGSPVPNSLREVEANSLNSLAMVSKRQGRYDEAERYLEQSLQAAREADDLAGQCRALNGLGMVVSRRGDLSQALARYQEALRNARACGDRSLEGALLNNLGNIHLRLGIYDQAGAHYERALEIKREIGARQKEISPWFNLAQGFAWMGMGHALLGLGALAEARAAYQESVTLRRELDHTHLTAEPLAGLARVYLAQGDLAQAQAHVEEILVHLGSGGTLDGTISPFQVYLTCYHVLEANDDPRAQKLLDTAHDLLQERAAKIGDEKMRHSFLESVAAHRELVQVFERMRDAE